MQRAEILLRKWAGRLSPVGVKHEATARGIRHAIQASVRSSPTAHMLAGSFGAQALIVVSGILAARLLGPEDRGYLAFLVLPPLILATVGGLGLPQALTYWAARNRGALAAVIEKVAPIYAVQIIGLTVVSLVVHVSFMSGASPDVGLASLALLVATPAVLTGQYAVAIAQGLQRFGLATVLILLAPALYAAALSLLAVLGNAALGPVAAAWSLSYACTAILGMALVVRGPPPASPTTRDVTLRDLLTFGLRGLPSLASPVQVLRLDQIAVWIALGPVALGLYVVALAFTNLPHLFATHMGVMISGKVAAQAGAHAASRSLAGMVAPVAVVSLMVAALVGLTAPSLIDLLFGRDFIDAAGATRILIVGAVAASLQRSIGDGLRAMGDPTASALGEAVSWIALVPGILFLPTVFGLEGVAIAVAASYCASLATVGLRWVYWRRTGGVARYAHIGAAAGHAPPAETERGELAVVDWISSKGQD